jgi:hypothetical protein
MALFSRKIWLGLASFLSVSLLTAGVTNAVVQGQIGTVSTGQSEIHVTIPPLFRISGFDPIYLGTYAGGGGDLIGNDDICVWTNISSGDYSVTITDDSDMTPGQFALENDVHTSQIPVEVSWNSTSGTAGNTEAAYGTPLHATGANRQDTDCSVGGLSANLQIAARESDMVGATAGLYIARLYINISPI